MKPRLEIRQICMGMWGGQICSRATLADRTDTTGSYCSRCCPQNPAPGVWGKQEISLRNTRATLTQFHLCVHPFLHPPFFYRPPTSFPVTTLPPLPQFFFFSPRANFPFAGRSAECCCLLCTQKFAEAVSCPQTSAPWSGAGEERHGAVPMFAPALPPPPRIRMCYARICLCLCACTCEWTIIQIGALYLFWSALLVAPRKQNTHLCNCTQGIQIHTLTHSRCTSFQLSRCTKRLVVKCVNEPVHGYQWCAAVLAKREKQQNRTGTGKKKNLKGRRIFNYNNKWAIYKCFTRRSEGAWVDQLISFPWAPVRILHAYYALS